VRIRGQTNAEVDVGVRAFRLAARADRADDLALRDRRPHANGNRPQVDERDRVPVLGADRQAAALARHLPRERDHARRGSAHVGTARRADVDAAVLPAGVRVVVSYERPQHRAIHRPAPRGRARRDGERNKQRDRNSVA